MIVLSLLLSLAPAAHVAAARLAAITYHLDPLVLLAIAEHETHWNSLTNGRSCGAMQVATRTSGECTALKDVTLSYLEGGRMLRRWLDASHGDLRRALRGYGCGFEPGTTRPADSCRNFDSWVLAHTDSYRRAAAS